MEDKEEEAVKMTITFTDGHTEDFDTFIAAVATGLTVFKVEEGRPIYMAEEGKFHTRGLMCIAGGTEIVAGLINTILGIIGVLIEKSGPAANADLLKQLTGMGRTVIKNHSSVQTKVIKAEEN